MEVKINQKMDFTNCLLQELLDKEKAAKTKLFYQQQHRSESQESQQPISKSRNGDNGKSSLIEQRSQSPRVSSAGRVMNMAARFMPRARKAAQQSREPSNDSTREYSELTTTLDYEELKSSTLSTDDDDEATTKDAGSLHLTLMSGGLTRARSAQLPQPEGRGVLRQTHSDTRDSETELESQQRHPLSASSERKSDSRV